jgi:hypothetical protein
LRLIYLKRMNEGSLHILWTRLLIRVHEDHVVINKGLLVRWGAVRSPGIVHDRKLRGLVSIVRVLLIVHERILESRRWH